MNESSRQMVQNLVETHQEDLHRMLQRRLGCPHDAADVAQEAYWRLLKSLPTGEVKTPKALLFHIAGQLAVNVWNRRSWHDTKHDNEEVLAGHVTTAEDPENHLRCSETQRVVRAAIDGMPPRQREAFVLHRFRNYSYPQIAQILSISAAMVEKHISAGMLECRKQLRQAGLLES